MKDQRQHPRYASELDAQIVIGHETVAGRTCDISMGGLSMLAQQYVPIRTPGSVRLALVFSDNEQSEQLTIPAEVVWCTPYNNAFQIGVKFINTDDHNRHFLELFIRFLDGHDDDVDEHDESEPI
jgi:c-di-GMP-binding flagellar brake protein YcgR